MVLQTLHLFALREEHPQPLRIRRRVVVEQRKIDLGEQPLPPLGQVGQS